MRSLVSLSLLAVGCAAGDLAASDMAVAGGDAGPVVAARADAGRLDAPPASACRPDSRNLRGAADLDFGGSGVLGDPAITLRVCRQHFPAGSKARAELEAAVALYGAVPGTAASLRIVEVAHRDVPALFGRQDSEAAADLEVLDTQASGYPGFVCHPDKKDTTCASWSMNTCRYRGGGEWGGGEDVGFVISVNARCFDFAHGEPPLVAGLAHELGHGFGMDHTDAWEPAQRVFSSTMQGLHPLLTAWDMAFLQDRYPAAGPARPALVASPVSRIASSEEIGDDTRYKKCFFDDQPKQARANPRALYRSGDWLKDCDTDGDPIFFTSWFNLGLGAAPGPRNALTLEDASGRRLASIREWCAADLPADAEDRLVWQSSMSSAPFRDLAEGAALTLRFAVGDDDAVTAGVVYHATRDACGAAREPNECVTAFGNGFR